MIATTKRITTDQTLIARFRIQEREHSARRQQGFFGRRFWMKMLLGDAFVLVACVGEGEISGLKSVLERRMY